MVIEIRSIKNSPVTTAVQSNMEVQKYLDRIGFQGNIEISLACLTKLQRFHQLAVPFENLDVFTNRKKKLIVEDLFQQIVVRRRGGWCHELNGLFSWLLRTLGFDVTVVSANYFDPETGKFKGEFDHMTLVVRLAGQEYLTDVGFGNIGQPYDPLRMTEDRPHQQAGGEYQLCRRGNFWLLQQQVRNVVGHHHPQMNQANLQDAWRTLFRYDMQPRELEDFQARCDEYETDQHCILAVLPILINKSDNGRVVNTLTGRRFTSVRLIEKTDVRTNQSNLTNKEYDEKLKTVFGIQLDQPLDIETIVLKED